MSKDPYHAVQAEIQSSLQTASNLRASYIRIRSTAGGRETEEVIWTRDELKGTLAALEADLEDLEGSVKMVEETGPRLFGLEEEEVMSRRRYVNQVKQELENIRSELLPPQQHATARRSGPQRTPNYGVPPSQDTPSTPIDEESTWSREEQQV
ncbi:t-SNARE [Cantharellus anzutake]|uniref:t-SNARE n=1 Tax=Cantharellus anzutake TaxID=1750568 RepID=UPI00190514BE|nr:t-SNARE [Cantharellus anzutake]KAF8342738.1 t-SNARE [Cantharellus anzutake]